MLGEFSGVWLALLTLGFVGGVISGSFGVGSGIIFIPALVLLFSTSQHSAQGTALAVMAPMALLGAFRYWHNPDVEVNMVLVALLVGGSLVGVLVGTEIAPRVQGHWLRKAFAIFMVIVAVRMFFMPAKASGSDADPSDPPRTNSTLEESHGDD
jgi:uncharacterized membrane protein YfcA